MADDQDALKTEYRRLLKVRAVFQQQVNAETEAWDGKGEKPKALAEAEANRDAMDIELARIADKVRF
jgi:hypothetical protein